MQYKARVVDEMLKAKLKSQGACVIEGPKWCGKTTTGLHFAASVLRMDNPAAREDLLRLSSIDPAFLLQGQTPRLIDEWQLAPLLWDAVRYEVDQRGEEGQFILTGSSVMNDSKEITHSGTGRFTWLKMRTMSLFESLESNGQVSLASLFDSPAQIKGTSELSLDDLAFLICRGGWPQAIDCEKSIALNKAVDYFDGVAKSDINRVDGTLKNEDRARRVLRSYARHIGTQASYTTLLGDIASNEANRLSENTLAHYINALKKIYVIEDMPAWNPNLRSKTAVRSSETRYFSDPSIAASALGIGPSDLKYDLRTFGFLFECLAVRDLRIYVESLGGILYHYRDKDSLECDAIAHLRNGKYGLIEIKLGDELSLEEGANTLTALAGKLDTSKMKQPSFLMVLTGVGKYAYRREDGIYIVPIGCLRN